MMSNSKKSKKNKMKNKMKEYVCKGKASQKEIDAKTEVDANTRQEDKLSEVDGKVDDSLSIVSQSLIEAFHKGKASQKEVDAKQEDKLSEVRLCISSQR